MSILLPHPTRTERPPSWRSPFIWCPSLPSSWQGSSPANQHPQSVLRAASTSPPRSPTDWASCPTSCAPACAWLGAASGAASSLSSSSSSRMQIITAHTANFTFIDTKDYRNKLCTTRCCKASISQWHEILHIKLLLGNSQDYAQVLQLPCW